MAFFARIGRIAWLVSSVMALALAGAVPVRAATAAAASPDDPGPVLLALVAGVMGLAGALSRPADAHARSLDRRR